MLIDYDSSREALFQPELRVTIFGAGAQPTFEALAVEAARLAYVHAESRGDALARLSADLAKASFGVPTPFNDSRTGSQGFGALREDGLGLIAFRGTQADRLRDLLTDIRFQKTPWPEVGGHVHDGFANGARALWPQVKAWLAETAAERQQLIICGHSLGAAIATLLAVPSGATRLVTIGSPRVGNADFSAAFERAGIETTRIVNFEDIVPRVPPSTFGYRHIVGGVLIDGEGILLRSPPPEAVDANIDLGKAAVASALVIGGGPLPRDLSDHAPVNYLRALWP